MMMIIKLTVLAITFYICIPRIRKAFLEFINDENRYY
jgi:hypothetical protein